MSGVMVATTIKSISSALTRAGSIERKAAGAPGSEVNSSLAAIWRSLIPVRVVIHSSEVLTIFSRSALVSTRSGTYEPTPAMEQVRPLKSYLARGFLNLGFVVGLMEHRSILAISLAATQLPVKAGVVVDSRAAIRSLARAISA